MDRSALLESLPFLVPASTRSVRRRDGSSNAEQRWPVPKLTEHDQGSQYQITDEVLVPRHCLSIEPLLMEGIVRSFSSQSSGAIDDSHDTNMGVAFFDVGPAETCAGQQRKQIWSDPALASCDLELCVYQKLSSAARGDSRGRHRANFSPSCTGTSGPTTGASIPRNQSRLDAPSSVLASLSMKVNDLVFYVNWTRLTRVQVEESTAEQEPSSKPPSFLLFFPGCLLRIFALDGESQQEPSGDSTSLLSASAGRYHAVKDALDQLLFKARSSHSFVAVPILSGSMLDSSFASSSPAIRTGTECSDGGKRVELAEGEAATLLKHRLKAHQQCLDEIASLWTLLQLKVSSTAARSLVANRFDSAASIGSVLTTAALDLATSYGEAVIPATPIGVAAVDRAVSSTSHREYIEGRLKQSQEQLDGILDEFFPAPRPRSRPTKRPRTVEVEASNRDAAFGPPTSTVQQGTTPAGEAAGEESKSETLLTRESASNGFERRLEALVEQHKRLTRERYDILALPTR